MRHPIICMLVVGLFLGASVTVSHAINEEAAFKRADRNGNGTLNRGEFNRFVRDLSKQGHRLARRATAFGNIGMSRAWATADANRDGKVTRKELQRLQ